MLPVFEAWLPGPDAEFRLFSIPPRVQLGIVGIDRTASLGILQVFINSRCCQVLEKGCQVMETWLPGLRFSLELT